jgi:hypothetical protein
MMERPSEGSTYSVSRSTWTGGNGSGGEGGDHWRIGSGSGNLGPVSGISLAKQEGVPSKDAAEQYLNNCRTMFITSRGFHTGPVSTRKNAKCGKIFLQNR